MPLYTADYLADTGHLSTQEHGAYILLIIHYWQTGSLPDDEDRLARIAKLTAAEWRKARPILGPLFKLGHWKHKRVERELSVADAKYEKRAEAGRKGGNAAAESRRDHGNAGSNATANDQAMLHQPQLQPQSHLQFKETKTFSGVGEKANGWSPPRHGATGKGRVYILKGSAEWVQYSEDYRSVHGTDPTPNQHGGKWFKTLGEQSA
jgi:uncharacterized protein YdaU (DUF1376 family)